MTERSWALLVALSTCLMLMTSAANSDCRLHPWPYANNTLLPGESLSAGQHIAVSTSYLVLETTGNLILYRGRYPSTEWPWWSTNTSGSGATRLLLTTTGDLQLQTSSGAVVWRAGTSNSTTAVLQDNCLFALYNKPPVTNQTWRSPSPMCITAHIVPHSHDDVGWLLTPERYYDGCHDPTGGVQSIIGTMVEALAANASRTFVQVESYFFHRWWERQNEATKQKCRDVVARGQFTFINGGWSMHDEACVHQESAISNMATGAQFLKNEFGPTSNLSIGWHIDPFGHASTTPRLMAQMGFNGFFFWRTDYEHRNLMMQTQTLESMWRPSSSLGSSVEMFTSILYNDYCVGCRVAGQGGFPMCPSSFCCYYCEQDRLPNWAQYFDKVHAKSRAQTHLHHIAKLVGVEELSVHSLRIDQLAVLYAQNILNYAANFRTNQVLIPWGCDFEHIDAHQSFSLMDEILSAINSDPSLGVHAFYSTPQTYLDAVASLNYSWPTNDYDYFLDSDNGHAYWSGYFSSRAEYKRFERFLMNQRSAVELALSASHAASFTNLTQQLHRVSVLQQAMGIAQHHDSITGTEREHVRDRYQYLLTEGLYNSSDVMSDVFANLTGVPTVPCYLMNLSSCDATDVLNASKAVTTVSVYIYNPLQWHRTEVIVIPVPNSKLSVLVNQSGQLVPVAAQVQPTWSLTTSDDPTSPPYESQPFEVLFQVTLPPLGLIEVVLMSGANLQNSSATPLAVFVQPTTGISLLNNEHYTIAFHESSGRLATVLNQDSGIMSNFTQNVMYYTPMGPWGGQASGAYIFRPSTPDQSPTPFASVFESTTVIGPVCSEVRQVISVAQSMYQTVRLCQGQTFFEITSGLGPVNPGSSGLEVIIRLESDVPSDGVWFTDSEGLELQQRLRNHHANYPHVVTEPVASNFYPCNVYSVINATTSNKSLAVIADYSRATASLNDGELEFLVLRRLLYDDNRGVAQPLNENIRLLSTSRILLNDANVVAAARHQSIVHTHPPVVRFGKRSTNSWKNDNVNTLPENVQLHSRQQVADGIFLVRLAHVYAVGEGPLATSVTVPLSDVLPSHFNVQEVIETDINGVLRLESANAQRMTFSVCDAASGVARQGPGKISSSILPYSTKSNATVVLHPMDIRTYVIGGTWSE